jgi:nucleotide-binding universal stress UspA family protein
VSEPSSKLRIRRILVALDASPNSLAALKAAAQLAANMEAELAGLFVEDADLFRIADLPSAREITHTAASQIPLSRAVLERRLRTQSSQLRKAIESAAGGANVRWTFETVRGQVTSALRAAATADDIIAIGRVGWASTRRSRIGSTARELAAGSVPLLLISHSAVVNNRRLLVYFDGSHASEEVLLVAAKLARAGTPNITVLLSAPDYETKVSTVRKLLEQDVLDVRCRRVDLEDRADVLSALKEERASMLILAGRLLLKTAAVLESLLFDVDVSLLLLGNGLELEETKSSTHAAK